MTKTVEIEEEMFDFETVTEQDVIAVPKDPDIPEYGSREWNEYVMGHGASHGALDEDRAHDSEQGQP